MAESIADIRFVKNTVAPLARKCVSARTEAFSQKASTLVLRYADAVLDSSMLKLSHQIERSGDQLVSIIDAGKTIIDQNCDQWPEMLAFCAPPTLEMLDQDIAKEKEKKIRSNRKKWQEQRPNIISRSHAWDFPLSHKQFEDREMQFLEINMRQRDEELVRERRALDRVELSRNIRLPTMLKKVVERSAEEKAQRKLEAAGTLRMIEEHAQEKLEPLSSSSA